MFVQVVVAVTNRAFDKEYSYEVPHDMTGKIQKGIRVSLPFGMGNRKSEGMVVNTLHDEQVPKYNEKGKKINYKSILGIIDEKPLVGEEGLSLVKWMKKQYICTHYDAIKCILPSFTSTTGRKIKIASLHVPHEKVIADMENLTINKIQHVKVLELLMDNKEMPVSLLSAAAGVSAGVIGTLVKYGYIKTEEITVEPLKVDGPGKGVTPSEDFAPTGEQKNALSVLLQGTKENRYREYLIHGVTGSGKTEIYLQYIRQVLENGQSAIVLVPEISLTPLMIRRFESRFPGKVAIIHSRMTTVEKRRNWKAIYEGRARVVIGPRSAVFAPVHELGTIIIDEEHESSYKSETTPKYDAHEIARFRCKWNGAVLIKGSATPSLESYYDASQNKSQLIELALRTGDFGLPSVKIIDMRAELEKKNKSMFSEALMFEMKKNLAKGEQTILYLNRRGYSSFVMCRKCGSVIKCTHCSISMTYHTSSDKLVCHYCGRLQPNPKICPSCGSNMIKSFGVGTQKVEEALSQLFPEASVIRMDMDTTTGRGSHDTILKNFENEKIDFLVGTQMVAKGHDFENVTLVGVLAADSSLNVDNYRAAEKTFQQLTQVAGRAGRGRLKGRVVIQTYNCDADCILCAKEQNYKAFYSKEILVRKMLDNPPFVQMGLIIIHGTDNRLTAQQAENIKKMAERYRDDNDLYGLSILGPAQSSTAMLHGRNRWRIIIKYPDRVQLRLLLTHIADAFYEQKNRERIELSLDINPYNMI